MPAPTALLSQSAPAPSADDEEVMINPLEHEIPTDAIPSSADMHIDEESRPHFPPTEQATTTKNQTRRITIPPHRLTPLRNNWTKIYPPLVEHLKLQVRMNTKTKQVEMRTSKYTEDASAVLQKGADFLKAFCLGFDVDDAISLLRLDDLYLETFTIQDVKPSLHGQHLSRAIGRIAGHNGRTKYTIENSTRTRIILADTKIHILGGFENIKVARDSICRLILGAPEGKVQGKLRDVGRRLRERY